VTSFFETFSKLKGVRSPGEKARLTAQASKLLEQEGSTPLEATLRPLILMTLRTLPQDELLRVVNGAYFHLRVATYVDIDYELRVAVGVTFLQDHLNSLPQADQIMLSELLELMELMNLDILVNDITVNELQHRSEPLHQA
jgi:hypothetical protein